VCPLGNPRSGHGHPTVVKQQCTPAFHSQNAPSHPIPPSSRTGGTSPASCHQTYFGDLRGLGPTRLIHPRKDIGKVAETGKLLTRQVFPKRRSTYAARAGQTPTLLEGGCPSICEINPGTALGHPIPWAIGSTALIPHKGVGPPLQGGAGAVAGRRGLLRYREHVVGPGI